MRAGEDREPDHDQCRDHRLRQRRQVRALPAVVRPAEVPRQHPLAAERVEVARGRVVEGHSARERAGDDQVAHHVADTAADEVLRRDEEELGRVLLRDLRRLVQRVVAGDRRPARDRVEDPEPDHGDVHRERDDPLRVLRLLRVVRRHLEADPRPEREEDAHAGPARREPASAREALERVDRVDRRGGDVVAALGEDPNVHDRQDDDLADQREAEQPGREAHVEVGQQRDQADHEERQPEPADVVPVLGELQVREVREAAGERGLEHRVGDHGRERRPHPELAAQPVADERVEAPGGRDLSGHSRVPDREDRQDDGREEEARRRADAVPEPDRDRRVEEHGGDRSGAGHGQEQDAHQSDRVLVEEVDVRPRRDVVHRRAVGSGPLLSPRRDRRMPRHGDVAHAVLLSSWRLMWT